MKPAERHIRRVVDAVNLPDPEPVHDAFLHHDLTAAAILFCRLEDQRHLPGKPPGFGQILRRAQKHRHMPVMPAGMHLARYLAGIGRAGQLFDRQGVHVGTQADHRPLALPLDDRHDPGLGDAGVNLVHTEFAQAIHDEGRRLMALEGQFRVFVQMPPPTLHFLGI